MIENRSAIPSIEIPTTPLVLSDRLIALAQDADRAGCAATAFRLVHLAHTVLDETPHLLRPLAANAAWSSVNARLATV